MPPSAPLPVRSTCVSAAGEVGGTGKSPLDSPPHPRCAVVGCHPDRRHRDGDRVCNRRRIGPQGANPRLYRLLYRRLRGGGPGRPAVGPVHRARPAATDTFLRRARGLLAVPRGHDRQVQRPLDQLRLLAHRTFPADAGHGCRRAADRTGQVVSRDGSVRQHRQEAQLADDRRFGRRRRPAVGPAACPYSFPTPKAIPAGWPR